MPWFDSDTHLPTPNSNPATTPASQVSSTRLWSCTCPILRCKSCPNSHPNSNSDSRLHQHQHQHHAQSHAPTPEAYCFACDVSGHRTCRTPVLTVSGPYGSQLLWMGPAYPPVPLIPPTSPVSPVHIGHAGVPAPHLFPCALARLV